MIDLTQDAADRIQEIYLDNKEEFDKRLLDELKGASLACADSEDSDEVLVKHVDAALKLLQNFYTQFSEVTN